MNYRVITVSQLSRYIKDLFYNDPLLNSILVKGEISNYKYHSSGHMYFTIKDNEASCRVVMFKGNNSKLKFTPQNGMAVIIEGYLSIYEKSGDYQIYAQNIQPDGLGALNLAFEQLKEKLKEEGLFDQKYKKTIPAYPERIIVLTSPTGAVIKDIINVISRRYPKVCLTLVPIPVQGVGVAKNIVDAISKVNLLFKGDLILLCRGGGSMEDLWPFNEEVVARAVFNSRIPIITGIGHETDFTICDYTSDLRAPTPSAAAELAVPKFHELNNKIEEFRALLIRGINNNIKSKDIKFNYNQRSRLFTRPQEIITGRKQSLDQYNGELIKQISLIKANKTSYFQYTIDKLNALNPLNVIARGYSIVKDLKDNIVTDSSNLKVGDKLKIILHKGQLECEVQDKTYGNMSRP